jgi:hypothetical protein
MSVEVVSATESVQVRSLTSDLYSLFLTPSQPSSGAAPATTPRPAATGCSATGVTPTVFVFSNMQGDLQKFKQALTSAQPMIDTANKLGNDVQLVFVACAATMASEDFEVAAELMKLKRVGNAARGVKAGNVHLVVGPSEMMMMPVAKGVLLDYLQESKFIHVVNPPDSTPSMWIKATPFGEDMVGKLPGIGVSEATGPRAAWINPPVEMDQQEWADEVNRRWSAATSDPSRLRTRALADSFRFWEALAVTDSLEREPSAPLEGLDATLGAFACGYAPFGVIERTFSTEPDGRRRTKKTWLCGASEVGVYWGVKTWCSGFAKAARQRDHHVLDRTADIGELQYIVNVTLSSLMRHSERDDLLKTDATPFAHAVGGMLGMLGPVWEGKRVTCWSTPERRKVILLLPEQYVRFVLQDFYSDVLDVQSAGHEAVGGTLFLDDDAEIPLVAPDLTAPEQRDFAASMGPRLFRVGQRGAREVPTLSTSADPLTGMRVVWTFAAGRDAPTLAPV